MNNQENFIEEGVITGLSQLHKDSLIDKAGLATIFNKHTVSVDRAIIRGEIPPPIKVLGVLRWTVGSLLKHIEARLNEEKDRVAQERKRLDCSKQV